MSVAGVDRFRWLQANALPQTWDSDGSTWLDVGGGGVIWTQMDVAPATAAISTGYVTLGGQTIAMPANPPTGFSVAFADKADDWDATNYLTITGNGNTFSQDSTGTYILDLKGAFAQFSFLEGQWQIVNFGRLSDAYGFDGNDFQTKALAFGENMLINGGFDIWQRGTSTTAVTTATYTTADRFWTLVTGGGAGTIGRSNTVPTGEGFAYSFFMNTTAGTNAFMGTSVELTEDGPFKTNTDYTISLWIRDGGGNLQAYYRDNIASGTNQVALGSKTLPDTAGWVKHEFTFNTGANVPNATNTMLALDIAGADMLGAKTTGWKLEEGATATPFTHAGNNIAGELAMCQRYFQKRNTDRMPATQVSASTVYGPTIQWTQQMRVAPTITYTGASVDNRVRISGVWQELIPSAINNDVDALSLNWAVTGAGVDGDAVTSDISLTADAEL